MEVSEVGVIFNHIKNVVNDKEDIDTSVTYQEIKQKLLERKVESSLSNEEYFTTEILPRMLILFCERWNLEDFDESVKYNSEYTVTNRNGAAVFTLQKIPFPKFYLENMVTSEEYERFITYLKFFILSHNLGSLYMGKLGVDIKFEVPLKEIVEICYQEIMNLNRPKIEDFGKKRSLIREYY